MAIKLACGSWTDDEYVGVLYPPDLPARARLATYATHFDHVEVNSTQYSSPRENVIESWMKQTPPRFTFNIRLHRAFSDDPREAAGGKLIEYLLKGVQPLVRDQRLGAFLLVLPHSFGPAKHQLDELDALCERLRPHPLAVELRHREWIEGAAREATLRYFRERGLVWVAVDMPQFEKSNMMPAVDEVTYPKLGYLRLHGRNRSWFQAKTTSDRHAYEYPEDELHELAARVRKLAAQAEETHVIANNHAQDFAPKTALALKRLLATEQSE